MEENKKNSVVKNNSEEKQVKEKEYVLKIFFRNSEKVITFHKITAQFLNNFINVLNDKNNNSNFIVVGNICFNKEEINHFSWGNEEE